MGESPRRSGRRVRQRILYGHQPLASKAQVTPQQSKAKKTKMTPESSGSDDEEEGNEEAGYSMMQFQNHFSYRTNLVRKEKSYMLCTRQEVYIIMGKGTQDLKQLRALLEPKGTVFSHYRPT